MTHETSRPGESIHSGARMQPTAPAIPARGIPSLTYALLAEQIESTGRCLAQLGIGRDDREMPGSHDSMLGEPHVHVLAAALSSCLVRAQERVVSGG